MDNAFLRNGAEIPQLNQPRCLNLDNGKSEPDNFSRRKPLLRYFLLFFVNLVIPIHLFLLFKNILSEISKTNFMQQIACLMYWDILIFLIAISGALYFLVMITGRSKFTMKKRGFPSGKFILVFFFFLSGISALFIFAPNFLFDVFFFHESKIRPGRNLFSQLPGSKYLFIALVTGICIGFDRANRTGKGRSSYWLTLPFLLIPLPMFNLFPLLWWHAGNFFFPSKIWKLWRPILVLISCFLPVLYYPISQPIRPDLPVTGKGPMIPIGLLQDECDGYFAEWVGRKPEFYLSCDQMFYKIAKINKESSWRSIDHIKLDFKLSLAALDQERGLGYLFNGYASELNIIALPTLEIIEKRPIPLRAFPGEFEMPFHALDSNRQQLFLADPNGLISIINIEANDQKQYQTVYFNRGGPIARIIYDDQSDLLFVLKAHRLLVLDPQNLKIVKEREIKQIAAGFVIDPIKELVYISMPRSMKVLVWDLKTLETKGEFDAPAACRFLAVDLKNRLLFVTAMSGVVEIRSLDDLGLLQRYRLSPWIHNVSVNSKLKRAIITVPENFSFIFPYDSQTSSCDLMDKSLQWFETVLRKSLTLLPLGKNRLEESPKPPLPRGSETVLIVLPNDKERELGKGILEWGGYRVLDVGSSEQAKEILHSLTDTIDAIVVDSISVTNLKTFRKEMDMDASVRLFLSVPYEDAMNADNPEKYLIRPFQLNWMLPKIRELLDEANKESK